jgi:hypothetical protein
METVQKARVTLEHAEAVHARLAFLKCEGLDAEGKTSHLDAVERGQCFKLTGPTGSVFYSVFKTEANQLWIYAASGKGRGLTQAGLYVVEQQAKAAGCTSVGFQTVRRGLIAKARALGYQITGAVGTRGHILNKAVA